MDYKYYKNLIVIREASEIFLILPETSRQVFEIISRNYRGLVWS